MEEIFFGFVLPDGRPLEAESELGRKVDFSLDSPELLDHISETVVKPISLPPEAAPAFVYRTDDPDVVKKLPSLGKAYGFKELWIHTWSQECLSAAILAGQRAGFPVRLVLEPLEPGSGFSDDDSDLTMIGITFREATVFQTNSPFWSDVEPVWGMPRVDTRDLLSPYSASLSANRDVLLRLASTPGLDGAVLLETEPPGYEPSAKSSGDAPIVWAMVMDLGFNVAARSRFLLENSVDPIDFVDTRYRIGTLNLSTPFFGGEYQFGSGSFSSSQPKGLYMKWIAELATLNHDSIANFAAQLQTPMLFQVRNDNRDMSRLGNYLVTPWHPGSELPTSSEPFKWDSPVPPDSYRLVEFDYLNPPVASRLYENLTNCLKSPNSKVALEFSEIPLNQLQETLKEWLKMPIPQASGAFHLLKFFPTIRTPAKARAKIPNTPSPSEMYSGTL